MMADPSAAERAYQQLKSDIIRGAVPAGPVEVRALADRLRMSVTPIREALARLSSERLVSLAPHQGYVVAAPSTQRLENLYDLSGLLVDACLERIKGTQAAGSAPAHILPLSGRYADDMTALVREIAMSQNNLEMTDQLISLNDRLYVARRCELQLFPNAAQEAESLSILFRTMDVGGLQFLLRQHYRLRVERIDALARIVAEAAGRI